ncbi:MAG: M48 family metalloprotease, partial [Acidobacteriota bacterium]
AREQGLEYLQSKSEQSKKAAKKNLEEAERILRKEIKNNPACEKCFENLVAAYFYLAYFGFSAKYDECIETAEKGLAQFPNNTRLAFTKAAAHYNIRQYPEAIKALKHFLAISSGDPQNEDRARQLLLDCQQCFLTGWYRQANFYQSPESRIEIINPQTAAREIIFQTTPEWELTQGANAYAQLASNIPQMRDPEIQSYLEDLISRLVSKTPGPNFNYKVTVVDSPVVNAVTVPGHIMVATGLFTFADTESELVGVLAHELAHNYGHHAARRFIKATQAQLLAEYAASIVRAINPRSQTAQLITQLAAQIGVGLFLNAYSRHEEKEADLYGAHILFNAGWNPTAMSLGFLKMYKLHPKQPVKFLSTHPPIQDRADYMTEYLEYFPLDREMRLDSEAFQKIKARLMSRAPKGTIIPPPQ